MQSNFSLERSRYLAPVQLLQKIFDFILYSNLYIGICALALVFTNQLTAGNEIYFDNSLGFVFFSTVFTYSFLKFRNPAGVPITTLHLQWAKEHSQLAKNILLISLIASVIFFFLLERDMKLVAGVLAAFTSFYGYVNIPFAHPSRKLRDFGLLKTLFVAIVWSVTTVVIPLSGGFIETDMLIFLLLRRFLFILALTIPFEIKDLKGDIKHGTRTLPVVLGVSNTKLLAQGILVALMLLITIQYFFFSLSLSNMITVNLSMLVSIVCIQPVKEETPEWWYYLILDGMMLLQFIFVYAAVRLVS